MPCFGPAETGVVVSCSIRLRQFRLGVDAGSPQQWGAQESRNPKSGIIPRRTATFQGGLGQLKSPRSSRDASCPPDPTLDTCPRASSNLAEFPSLPDAPMGSRVLGGAGLRGGRHRPIHVTGGKPMPDGKPNILGALRQLDGGVHGAALFGHHAGLGRTVRDASRLQGVQFAYRPLRAGGHHLQHLL